MSPMIDVHGMVFAELNKRGPAFIMGTGGGCDHPAVLASGEPMVNNNEDLSMVLVSWASGERIDLGDDPAEDFTGGGLLVGGYDNEAEMVASEEVWSFEAGALGVAIDTVLGKIR